MGTNYKGQLDQASNYLSKEGAVDF
jgi:hypothetical protein